MNNRNSHISYLIFSLDETLYALDSSLVRDLIPLPELKPKGYGTSSAVGLVNYHRQVLPVLDILLCLGYPPRDFYNIGDCLVLLQYEGLLFGVVFPNLIDVGALNFYATQIDKNAVTGEGKVVPLRSNVGLYKEDAAIIIDPEIFKKCLSNSTISSHLATEMAKIRPEDKSIFAQRAEVLSQAEVIQKQKNIVQLLIFKLKDEYYALEPEYIKEICQLADYSILPTAPPHVAGLMNFRGVVITLVDVWKLITDSNLPFEGSSKVIIATFNALTVGLIVDDVLTLASFPTDELKPSTLLSPKSGGKYITNYARYFNAILGILNIRKIFEYISKIDSAQGGQND